MNDVTPKEIKMMKLSARFEIRRNGVMNSARFTKEAADRIAWSMRAQGCAV